MEVDIGYEGASHIVLAEAKIDRPEDFIVRQLFYPCRSWGTFVPNKEIRTFFFVFESATFTYALWEYAFSDPSQYESITLVKRRRYRIVSPAKDKLTLTRVAAGEAAKELPKQALSVPQADTFDTVAELPIRVARGLTDSVTIAKFFDFTTRQSSYYRHAAKSLGLVVLNQKTKEYELTDVGRRYVSLPAEQRNTLLGTLVLNLPLMRLVLDGLQEKGSITLDDISEIIGHHGYNEVTSHRRAQTIMAWLRWLESNLGVVSVEGNKASVPL